MRFDNYDRERNARHALRYRTQARFWRQANGEAAHRLREARDRLASLESDLARLREIERAARDVVASCDCRGTGKLDLGCRCCGDSTYDHECEERFVECLNCKPLRTALEKAWEVGR